MTGSSMLLTIGTVLDRAKSADTHVTVLVRGTQFGFSGLVIARDSEGVALDLLSGDIAFIRLADVTAVRVSAAEVGVALTPAGDMEVAS